MSTLSYSDLQNFFQKLKIRSLDPHNPFYVNYLHKRENDPIKELFNDINFSENESVNFFSGQRGCGKTTELHRLRFLLEEKGYVVFICDMQNYINLHLPIEITDFLIAIMLALNEAIEKQYGENLALTNSYIETLKDFFSKVQITDIEIASFKVSLRQDPNFKQRLQRDLDHHITTIAQQAHEFSQQMVEFIRKQTNKNQKIVLLIDSLEQMRGTKDNAELVHESLKNLFSFHSEKLFLKNFHTVYTIPPYLPALANIGSLDNGSLRAIDNIHVFKKSGEPDSIGLSIMQDIIELRFKDWEQIFSHQQLENIILATGGDLRDFFRLIQIVLTKIPSNEGQPLLPVEDKIIEYAKNDLLRNMLPIPEDNKVWLRKISKSKNDGLESITKLSILAQFFDLNWVQNYRNGSYWYDIHPLLKEAINE
jgi:hypothetical protein